MLPNIILIGAARCGTTSLWRCLDLHPDIAMSATKELNFFADHPGSTWSRGLDWYEAQFDSSAPLRGEASPNYTVYPVFPGAAERIAATVPDARLIYVVRDPISRLLSAYRTTRFVWGIEQRELDEAVADPDNARLVVSSC